MIATIAFAIAFLAFLFAPTPEVAIAAAVLCIGLAPVALREWFRHG